MVSGQLPPRKIAPWFGLGFGSRLGLVLGLGGNQVIVPKENCLTVRVRVWVRVSFEVGGNFPWGQLSSHELKLLNYDWIMGKQKIKKINALIR